MQTIQPSNLTLFRLEQLPVFLLIYCGASLFHFAHNAIFIDDYPNMPATTTALKVVIGWLAITSIGIMGYLLSRRHQTIPALLIFAVYGALGLAGLGHYNYALFSAHTFTMNLSIWLEVGTAIILLVVIARLAISLFHTAKK